MAHMERGETYEHYPVRLGARGRLVVPATLRQRLGLKPGQLLTFTIDRRDRLQVPRLTTAHQELEILRERLDRLSRKKRGRRPR